MNKLNGKTALITGASSGIGKAIALAYAREGAQLALTYKGQVEEAFALKQQIENEGGKAITLEADLTNDEQVLHLFGQVAAVYNSLDILVCSSTLQKEPSFAGVTSVEEQKTLEINLASYFACAWMAVNRFLQAVPATAQKAGGSIIFINSVTTIFQSAEQAINAAAKSKVSLLTQTLAEEVATYKIRVNAISPGVKEIKSKTRIWPEEGKLANLFKQPPPEQVGQPEEVTAVALWLAGTDSEHLTGSTLYAAF